MRRCCAPRSSWVLTALLLGLALCVNQVSSKKRAKSTKTKKAAKCIACTRMVRSLRGYEQEIRKNLEPMREKKIETGRGADSVYNKRFTKGYDVELLGDMENALSHKACAQPEIMSDLALVRACRSIRDEHAEEIVKLLLHGDYPRDDDAFCTGEIEACTEAAAAAVPDWSAPALRTESAADALSTWHRALAQQPLPAAAGAKIGDGGVHAGTAATFFEGVLGLPGDVLLLLYSASDAGAGGPHSGLSSAWAELAHALAGHDGGDRLSFAVLARDVNDLPIALSPALPDETVAEVLVFAKDAHDSPTALFGGNGPPAAKTGDTSVEGTALAFKMEVVRQLVMRARDKSYGQLASTLLGELNKAEVKRGKPAVPSQAARLAKATANAKATATAKAKTERTEQANKAGSRRGETVQKDAEQSCSAHVVEELQECRRTAESTTLKLAALRQENDKLRLVVEELRAMRDLQ